ncbi:energy transducer TonB [Spirosoma rhododendri]|uniref:Energy transducer TonB n=1 Tax=Spirosoma rhododendri TaxID=2728024 RepID=A0A7L5DW89_9BACT|nr:energy transducer TonB [Spirosoma rhododendri]QJD80247.1 energy transducer TonB [Spirosoma rhododendri]
MANRNPEFPGGIDALLAYVDQHSTYPIEAAQAAITGKVFISFIVSKTGDVTNVSVLQGLGYGCDEEAVRLVREMPRWIPGKQNDEYVNVKYTLPVSFGTGN